MTESQPEQQLQNPVSQSVQVEAAWQQHKKDIAHAYRFHEGVNVDYIALLTFDDGQNEELHKTELG
ncbi:hypothetical protein N9C85_01175 [Synechococcus sp. AH-224-I15]|nr:hypothetical protein [Synechococcus sp. AH-224-I15]